MAATNFTPIQLYHSTTASAAPVAGNLANGELAINITDGKLFYKDNGGNVQVLATKGTGTIGGSNTQVQYNSSGALAGSSNFTFNGTTATINTLNLTNALGTTYGGTGLNSYTTGDIVYASASNTLSKLTIGTNGYILTSNGSIPTWTAGSSISVNTATNLAGGATGSVPYQSGAGATTFLSIGSANTVLTSSGTGPQWVTSLSSLTGVSSSAMTNTSLTSGRVVYSTTGGAQTDSASLTFNGTTLTASGFATGGSSTLDKLVKIGDSAFNLPAVLSATAPAKLYVSTATVTDASSAGGATNSLGTITSFGSTTVAASNTGVTYTNLATLYIAGAPTAGTNVTITNPYALYVAAGKSYFGGDVVYAGGINLNGNVTIGDSSADTLTINSTITSNLIFTDNTYDIGASGATRPRNLFLAGNATISGNQTLTGSLTVDSTTDTSSATTGSIQTDGGVGIAKGLYVGGNTTLGDTSANTVTVNSTITSNLIFTDNTYDIGASGATRPRNLYLAGNAVIAGSTTLSGGTANGIVYLNASKVLTAGSLLNFNGANIGFDATPSNWPGGRPTLEFGGSIQSTIAFNGNVTNGGAIWTNSYYDGSLPVYKANGFASVLSTDRGGLTFSNAASGTAGATLTWRERFHAGQSEFVINDESYDYDFRVESDTNTHALFVDAGNNRIGLFTAGPNTALHAVVDNRQVQIESNSNSVSISGTAYGFNREVQTGNIYNAAGFAYQWNRTLSTTATSDYLALQVYTPAGAGVNARAIAIYGTGEVAINSTQTSNGYFYAGSALTPYMLFVDSNYNRVGINTSSPQNVFHVRGTHTSGTATTMVVGSSASGNSGLNGGIGFSANPTTKVGSIFSLGSDSGIAIYTNQGGTDYLRVNVDYLGRFTAPYQPRFYAVRSGDQTGYDAGSTGDVVVIYNSASENVGSHYNTSTGKFTAPVAGLYIFSHSVLTITSSVVFSQAWLVINGARAEGTDVITADKATASGIIQVYLNANDSVGVHYYSAGNSSITIQQNVYHTYFKGYLVS